MIASRIGFQFHANLLVYFCCSRALKSTCPTQASAGSIHVMYEIRKGKQETHVRYPPPARYIDTSHHITSHHLTAHHVPSPLRNTHDVVSGRLWSSLSGGRGWQGHARKALLLRRRRRLRARGWTPVNPARRLSRPNRARGVVAGGTSGGGRALLHGGERDGWEKAGVQRVERRIEPIMSKQPRRPPDSRQCI